MCLSQKQAACTLPGGSYSKRIKDMRLLWENMGKQQGDFDYGREENMVIEGYAFK